LGRHFRLSLLAPPEAKHNEVQYKTPPAWLRHALNPGRRKFTETRRVKLTPTRTLKKNYYLKISSRYALERGFLKNPLLRPLPAARLSSFGSSEEDKK
jgi:hypothetical protein